MKDRIISVIVMLVLIVPVIYIGGLYYYIGCGLVASLAYKEVVQLPNFKNVPTFLKIFTSLFFIQIVFSGLLAGDFNSVNIYYIVCLYLVLILSSLFSKNGKFLINDALYLAGFLTFIGVSFAGLIFARRDIYEFLFLISIPIFSDSFAMVSGMLLGKNKLCPSISPNKTIEGSVCGLIASVILPLLIYHYLIAPVSIFSIGLVIILAIFSQLGDLIFSKIKRENKIKDFSNLIKGHGGVLDRLDSVLLVSIIYLVIMSII